MFSPNATDVSPGGCFVYTARTVACTIEALGGCLVAARHSSILIYLQATHAIQDDGCDDCDVVLPPPIVRV